MATFTMKKVWSVLGFIGLLIAMAVGGGFGNLIGREVANTAMGPDLETVLAKTASDLNSRLPMMVDKETRLDSTVAGPGKKFMYLYTLVGHNSGDLDPTVLTPHVKKNTCGLADMKAFWENGVSATYVYRGNDAREIGRVTVTPSDCGYR
jgi:hypothetical protein